MVWRIIGVAMKNMTGPHVARRSGWLSLGEWLPLAIVFTIGCGPPNASAVSLRVAHVPQTTFNQANVVHKSSNYSGRYKVALGSSLETDATGGSSPMKRLNMAVFTSGETYR